MISERANQMAPAFITNNSTISVEATPPKTWRDDSARVSIALQRLNIDTWETISTPLSKLSAGIARWASIAVRLAMADLSASEWAWGDEPTLTKEQRNQLGIEWEPGTSFLSAAGNANEAPGSYDFWFIPEDWRFLAASLDTRWLTEKRSGQQSAVLLLDEPEVHLHLDAQREVKKWVIDLANDGFHIADSSWKLSEQKPDVSVVPGATIVATHSPLCLDYPSDQATTTFVFADTPERSSQSVMPEGFNLQETLKELGPKLGLTFTDAISLYKGFVIVEGPHDEEIINHFYKTELNKHRIGLLRAFGTNNIDNKNKGDRSFALYEQDLLTYIGLPVAILVDRATLGPGEKKAVNAFVRSCKKRGLKSWPKEENQTGGHPYPDIIAALPDEAVKAAFPKANFESWDPIVDEFENLRRKRVTTGNFKDFAKDKMGLQKAVLYPTFIQPVLKECEETLRPREGLENIMKQIFAFFEEE
jgi:hypothetical protein